MHVPSTTKKTAVYLTMVCKLLCRLSKPARLRPIKNKMT
ncbi:Uncharacterised protein [Vibrio cholerae]|nr:Uncharacterised protein [Vibrio cholerae]